MKITVYSSKGGVWKTPLATNLALEHGYAIATNETYHVFDGFIPEERLISLDLNESFPDFGSDVDVVFDLAWTISKNALSITSALKMSDLVIVPICNEVKAINAWLNTIAEVLKFNPNVIVVATKLKKKGWFVWEQSEDFLNIQNAVHTQINANIPVLPLKYSAAFDAIFEQERSIKEIMQSSPLAAHHYKEVNEQLERIYQVINK